MKRERVIRYNGKNIIVYFHVDRCTHVSECIKGLPKVFNSTRRPWVKADEAKANKVAEIILKCPTGALHFKRKDEGWEETPPDKNTFTIEEDGPIYLHGDIKVIDSKGELIIEDTRLAFCRCGQSQHMPLCDGSHDYADFNGTGKIPKDKTQIKNLENYKGSIQIRLTPNGPLLVKGPMEIKDNKNKLRFRGEKAALCRCGQSKSMPFCDGTHKKVNFKTED